MEEESEEIDYERPDVNIQEIIEEMKKRRRNFEDNKSKSTSKPSGKVFEDYNPMRVVQEHENKQGCKYKILTLVSRGHCLVGAVFHTLR